MGAAFFYAFQMFESESAIVLRQRLENETKGHSPHGGFTGTLRFPLLLNVSKNADGLKEHPEPLSQR
ncbi:MAG: hypothetical protein DI606_07070 [Sphingobium sp.]|uniref:hypothetical protein n=1 Tax=Sphingobium sp. TaxID=1912891 RepID=UPI000DB6CCC5|nr:hypothetical protein [Sphingobium sp.]PZU13072.1 MAG: hypothetical protein DI606_07070 [Sphingobium sp.]